MCTALRFTQSRQQNTIAGCRICPPDHDPYARHQSAESFFVLLLLTDAGYLTVFALEQLHALVLLFLNAHEAVVLIGGLAFGGKQPLQ